MKRLLIPLLAVIALPSAVSAETWYLLGRINKANNWTVPMPNQAQCESEGERFINNKNSNDWKGYIGNFPSYICIKGK
tara:strand:- start:3 stop:236 length:234 start_codon:yes stop_codon:yes gene_type:complete